MKRIALALLASTAPAMAQDTRELDAHVHGVTEVQIAVDGTEVEIMLHAPGFDIVGFEHEATGDADKAAVEAAVLKLGDATAVVALNSAAGCALEDAEAELHGKEHEEHAEGEDHEAHEEHAEGEDHDDHDGEQGGHSEFEAHYHFQCEAPDALTTVAFPFFDSFPNAEEIEAEFVTESGAGAAEVTRDAPELTLK